MTLEEYKHRRIMLGQMQKLAHQEARALKTKPPPYIRQKVNPTLEKISEKVPEKVITTLEKAFEKAFVLIFEKGSNLIGKTCQSENRRAIYDDVHKNLKHQPFSRKEIRRLDVEAKLGSFFNTSFSATEGAVLGVLGIAMPDIPLFIAIVLKTIYEISLSYGYDYTNESEQIFQLLLICAAVGAPELKYTASQLADQISGNISKGINLPIFRDEAVSMASKTLCSAMLEGKLVQGVPIIGIYGGFSNGQVLSKVSKIAIIKYKKRFLQEQIL